VERAGIFFKNGLPTEPFTAPLPLLIWRRSSWEEAVRDNNPVGVFN